MEQEADASFVDATWGAAKLKDIAVVEINVGKSGVNAFIVGNDLHVAGYEYRCVGGVLVGFSIFIDEGGVGAKKLEPCFILLNSKISLQRLTFHYEPR